MYIKINDKPYLNDENLAEIVSFSGEILTGENCFKITKDIIPGNIESKKDVVFNISDNKIQYKTDEQKQQEIVIKTQNELLNSFKPLIDAMTFQEISLSKGSDSKNIIFTDTEIKNWGDYIAKIANGNIGAEMPSIPEKYKKLI